MATLASAPTVQFLVLMGALFFAPTIPGLVIVYYGLKKPDGPARFRTTAIGTALLVAGLFGSVWWFSR